MTPCPTLKARPEWCRIDLISDLHLQAREPQTAVAFQRYLAQGGFDALLILGDLFEVWIGDDLLLGDVQDPDFELAQACVHALSLAAQRAPVYVMHGNRDFLLGPGFARSCGGTLLQDPTVLAWGEQRYLLSHGDAWCLDDSEYLKFRATVRQPAWQREFLNQTLEDRARIARHLRMGSETHKQGVLAQEQRFADVDNASARHWLLQTGCQTLIHGHTHRAGQHDLGAGLQRLVLSDWDASTTPPRLEALSLYADGSQRRLALRP